MFHQVPPAIRPENLIDDNDLESYEYYRSLIVDHASHPRHFGPLEGANWIGEAENPVCGDRYRVFLKIVERKLETVRFTGTGCSISMASASMMAEVLDQTSIDEIRTIIDLFFGLFSPNMTDTKDERLGDLVVFVPLRRNLHRINCATLPWNALKMTLPFETAPDDL